MIKKLFLLVVGIMLSTVSVRAQRNIVFMTRDSVEIAVKDAPNFKHQRFVYGLYKNGKEILPIAYDMVEEPYVHLIAFFKDTEMLVYDTNGKLIDRTVLEFPVDRHSVVQFEEIDYRCGKNLYELVIYYHDNTWIYQPIGTYYRRGSHLYKVIITAEYVPVE